VSTVSQVVLGLGISIFAVALGMALAEWTRR
jgi:hypothetical protein